MDFSTCMKFEHDGSGRGAYEVGKLCDIVVSKHEHFNSSTKVGLGKGFKPLYQVFKLSPVGRFCLVEFLP
jgi:hypothetical protein